MSELPISGVPAPGQVPPGDGHRWLSLTADDGGVWMFDVTFLLSGFGCIYGTGCPSIDTEIDLTESLGCCLHGAHVVDKDDLDEVTAAVKKLAPDEWQFMERAKAKGGPFKKTKNGDIVTRKVDGACIMLNRPDHPGGAGCALHQAALARDERPLDWKPDVCWQVPIRLDIHTDDYEHDTVFVRAWERRDWGAGGSDFHWWCIEEPAAHQHASPVYETSRDELVEMVGEDIYRQLALELDRLRAETPVVLRSTAS